MAFLASSFGVSNGAGSETAHIYEGLENASNLLALSLTNSPNAPRAYLMCMVFDQDYVLIDPTAGGYDFYAPVPEAAATETQNISLEIDIPAGGKYIYTYVANESAGTHVFFDDFTVAQLGVDITETTDYYPFGSVMSHWQKEDYRHGYQGQFSEEDEETGFNAFELRAFDSNIGRWMAPDPFREFASPYNGMGNNPVYLTDPRGGCTGNDPDCVQKGAWSGKGGMIYDAKLDAYVLGEAQIGGTHEFVAGAVSGSMPIWMSTMMDVEFHLDANISGKAGLLAYGDVGVAGISKDILSTEVFKIGFKHDFVEGQGSYDTYGQYIFKDGLVRLEHGTLIEAGLDGKYKVSAILDLNKSTIYLEKGELGGGAPFVEVKSVQRHTGVHSLDLGLQEEIGVGVGTGIKADFKAVFQINFSNPNWNR